MSIVAIWVRRKGLRSLLTATRIRRNGRKDAIAVKAEQEFDIAVFSLINEDRRPVLFPKLWTPPCM